MGSACQWMILVMFLFGILHLSHSIPNNVCTTVPTTDGGCCVFPFQYRGQWHHFCTTRGNNGKLWCSKTNNYPVDKQWGNCKIKVFDVYGGIHPAIASPVKNHALSQNVFHTEEKLGNSYECLIMCQLEPQCKSFNFSHKLQICELNSATKKEFPKDYGYRVDYAYYHMGSGMVKAAKQDL